MSLNGAQVGGVAGDYPFGQVGHTATWDGQAWTGARQDSPSTPAPDKWKHAFLPFLRHRWFWLCVLGLVIMVVPAMIASIGGTAVIQPVLFLGSLLFMTSATLIVMNHMGANAIERPRLIVTWGIVSGIVAVAVAYLVEEMVLTKFLSESQLLWQAGITEETSKLIVPVLLLAFGGAAFRSPRAGLFLVLLSGATFGAIELVRYAAITAGNGVITTVLERSTAELLHPYITGFAAVLIWLGAWRRQKVVTAVGIVGWVIAMALHSLHDGLMGIANSNVFATDTASFETLGLAIFAGIMGLVLQLLITVIFFLILRHAARELTPPEAVFSNARSWRPRIVQWGVAKAAPASRVASPQN